MGYKTFDLEEGYAGCPYCNAQGLEIVDNLSAVFSASMLLERYKEKLRDGSMVAICSGCAATATVK